MFDFKVPVHREFWPGKPRFIGQIESGFKTTFDESIVEQLAEFISCCMGELADLGLRHAVVGLSGGLDSTCNLYLCKRALGSENVTAVIVDLGLKSHVGQALKSRQIAEGLGIPYHLVDASGLFRETTKMLDMRGPFSEINMITRCIQTVIFQVADSIPGAVVSNVDRSETELCRHMECFYGHLAPLAHLYKSEVMDLARFIGVPEEVITQEPGCLEAWLDRDVLGAGYDLIDFVLYMLIDRGLDVNSISAEYGIDENWLKRLEKRIKFQKRRMTTRLLCKKVGGDEGATESGSFF